MDRVMAVVLPTGVVENCEQPNDFLDRAASGCNEQPIAFDSTPVRRTVDGIAIALKFTRDVLPDAVPLRSRNAHVPIISTSLPFLRAICAVQNGGNAIRLHNSNRRKSWCHGKGPQAIRSREHFREPTFRSDTF